MVLLLAAGFALPLSTRPVHGALTGVVCLTRAPVPNCPLVPLTFNATGVGSTFTVNVYINNSQAMGGFDIYVAADPTILNPTGATLGPLIVTPTSTIICINNSSITGACTVKSANGPGVVEVSTIESLGSNECGGISPCSGLAFSITYSVVANTASTPIFFPSSPGCGISSVSGDICVSVADSVGTILPETALAGDFTDLNPAANFMATPVTGSVPLAVSFDASLSVPSPGKTISQYNWDFGDGTPVANITSGPMESHTYVTPGNYTPTLEVVDSAGLKSTIKDTLVIDVACSYICASPSNLNIIAGNKAFSTIKLTGIVPFNGTIALQYQVSPTVANGPAPTLNTTSVTLPPGGTKHASLNISTTVSTLVGSYVVNVTATAGTLHYSVLVNVVVTLPDFEISANPTSLTISQNGNGLSTLTLTSLRGFNGPVTLSATNSSKYVVGFPTPFQVKLTSTAGTNMSTLYVIVQSGAPAGDYNVKVTGSAVGVTGPLSHNVNVTITVPPPDFTRSATPSSVTVKPSANATSAITFTGLNGFSDTIDLHAKISASVGISTVFSPSTVSINTTSGPATSTMTITTQGTTPTGTYTITVNGTALNLHIQHFVNITVTVVSPQLPSIQLGSASLSTVSAQAGNSVTMTVTVSNTGSIPTNITVTMDVNSGSGSNITVAQETLTLNVGQQAQTLTLAWNTTQWNGGTYHIYARVIGSQTNKINQSQSAGTVALTAPPAAPSGTSLSVLPWVTTGIAAVAAVLFAVLFFARRRSTKSPESA